MWVAAVSSPIEPTPIVPMTPVFPTAAESIDSRRKEVEVLPLVPVIPTSSRPAAGSEKNFFASSAAAMLVSPTTQVGRSLSYARPTTRAEAPFRTASSIKSCPSIVWPFTATKRSPRRTPRESVDMPLISGSA